MWLHNVVEEFCKYKDIQCNVDAYVEDMLKHSTIAKDQDLDHKCKLILSYLIEFGPQLPVTPHSSTPMDMLEHFEFFQKILWNMGIYTTDAYVDYSVLPDDAYNLYAHMQFLTFSDVRLLFKKFKKFYTECKSDYKLAKQLKIEGAAKEDLATLLSGDVYAFWLMKNAVSKDLFMGVNPKPVDYVFTKMIPLLFKKRLGRPFMFGIDGGKLLCYKGLVKHEPRYNEARSSIHDCKQEDSGKDGIESFSGSLGRCLR